MNRSPSKLIRLAVLALALGAGRRLPAQTASPSDVPLIPGTSATSVLVDVVVVDKDGRPVTDLTVSDFVVRDEGRPQTIAHFEMARLELAPETKAPARVSTNEGAGRLPAGLLAIVFDERHITPETFHGARDALDKLLSRGLRPGEETLLVATGRGEVWAAHDEAGLANLRAKAKRLRALRRLNAEDDLVTDYEAMLITTKRDMGALRRAMARLLERERANGGLVTNRQSGRAMASRIEGSETAARFVAERVYHEAATRAKVTLQVLAGLAERLASRPGRKSVVLLSEGFIADPSEPEWRHTLEVAHQANVVFYGVDVRGLRANAGWGADNAHRPMLMEADDSVLSEVEASEGSDALTAETGGFTRRFTNDLADALARIAEESRGYYLLGFQPDVPTDGSYRRLKVEVRRPGLTVRARRGYYATSEAAREGTRPGPRAPIPLRLTAYVREPRASGLVHVQVVGEIDPGGIVLREQDGQSHANLEWKVQVGPEGGATPREESRRLTFALSPDAMAVAQTAWLPVVIDFDLRPGAQVARLVVLQGSDGRAGRVEHPFEVPAVGGPYLSTPIVSDMVGAPGGGPKRVLLARRTFAAGSRLLCEFEVQNAPAAPGGEPQVSAGHAIRDVSGRVLTESPATPLVRSTNGRLARQMWISLERTPPGRYELVVRARDEVGETELLAVEEFDVVLPVPNPAFVSRRD